MSAIGSGGVYHRGFGIKKRSWFGGRSRPAFMEPLVGVPLGVPLGVPPPRDGNYVRLVGGGGGLGGGGGGGVGMRRSSFPIKDDAEYIGYLSDDDESGGGGGGGGGGSGDEGEEGGRGMMMSVVDRRRRELVGSDLSFSGCMLMMITVGGLLMLFIFAVSPWGVPPPRRL
jgi:hypothetical protein